MAIALTDLVAYASASMPEDETSLAGGAIDGDTRIAFTDLAANDDVEVLSDNAADTTQEATVRARNLAGEIVTETVTLNGTTAVIFSTLGVVERILSFSLNGDAAGTVTLRRSIAGATIGTVPTGERGFRRLFIGSYSESAPKVYYTKFFWSNNHATLSLLSAFVEEFADPTALIEFALADALNDSETIANRLTAPVSVTAFGNADITLLTATAAPDLPAGDAIGVWLKLSLASNNAPIKSTYTSQLTGQSV